MTTILVNVGDERRVIDEERQDWLRRVLVAFGADKEAISGNTMEARRHVSQLGLDVVKGHDGSIDIHRFELAVVAVPDGKGTREVAVETNRQLVAQWMPPKMVRVREASGDHYRIALQEWALPFQMEQ
jgi:hypothetical protein